MKLSKFNINTDVCMSIEKMFENVTIQNVAIDWISCTAKWRKYWYNEHNEIGILQTISFGGFTI